MCRGPSVILGLQKAWNKALTPQIPKYQDRLVGILSHTTLLRESGVPGVSVFTAFTLYIHARHSVKILRAQTPLDLPLTC